MSRGRRGAGWALLEALLALLVCAAMAAAALAAAACLGRARELQRALAEQQEAEALVWARIGGAVARSAAGSVIGWGAAPGDGFALRSRPGLPDCLGQDAPGPAQGVFSLRDGALRCAVDSRRPEPLVGGDRLHLRAMTLRYGVALPGGRSRIVAAAEVAEGVEGFGWAAVTRIELGLTIARPPAPELRTALVFALPAAPCAGAGDAGGVPG